MSNPTPTNDAAVHTEEINKLSERVDETTRAIAELSGMVTVLRNLFAVVSIIVTLVVVAGGAILATTNKDELNKAVKNAKDANELANNAAKKAARVEQNYAEILQVTLIDRIETAINSFNSLDELREKPLDVKKIQSFGIKLKQISEKVADEKRTSYFWTTAALTPYLHKNYQKTLEILDKVEDKDRHRYAYAYMRGICLLRTNKENSDVWFNIAAKLSGGIRYLKSMNALGMAKLYEWQSTKERATLNEAIDAFSQIINRDAKFAPAYFNLASAYAAAGKFDVATKYLLDTHRIAKYSMESIANRVKDDLQEKREKFFFNYVREELKINTNIHDPEWHPNVMSALYGRL